MCWNNVKVQRNKPMCTKEDSFHMEEEMFVLDKRDCMAKILDAKYKLANLKELTADLPQLTANQREQLYDCLNKRAVLFDSMLGL